MKRRFLSIGILVLALLAIVACDSVLPVSDDYEIRVLISYPKNTVDSPADYVYVKPGEDVYYPITLNRDLNTWEMTGAPNTLTAF